MSLGLRGEARRDERRERSTNGKLNDDREHSDARLERSADNAESQPLRTGNHRSEEDCAEASAHPHDDCSGDHKGALRNREAAYSESVAPLPHPVSHLSRFSQFASVSRYTLGQTARTPRIALGGDYAREALGVDSQPKTRAISSLRLLLSVLSSMLLMWSWTVDEVI
jgi:hypothetical protein